MITIILILNVILMRSTQHIIDAAVIGADIFNITTKVIHELYNHPLTEKV